MPTTANLTPNDLAQIRYVTENYKQMQGLRWIPFGAALLAATPLYAGWAFAPGGVMLALWLLPLALGFALHWLIGAYYTRTFGHVQPARSFRPGRRQETAFWVLFLAALLLSQHLNSFRVWLVLLSLGGFFSVVPYLWRSGGLHLRVHWLVLSTLVAVTNLALLVPLPLLRPDRWSDHALLAVWAGSVGIAMVAGGLLDHRLLEHSLIADPDEGHAQTV